VLKIRDEGLYKDLEKTRYVDDKKITDHYAIIPTGNLSMYGKLTDLQKKVYDLIVRRFLSIFYPPAVYEKASLILQVGKEKFYTNVKSLKDPGYFEIAGMPKSAKDKASGKDAGQDEGSSGKDEGSQNDEKDTEDEDIDNGELLELIKKLHKGDIINVVSFDIKEGKTSPPKRYTSGSMVLAMENAGQLIEDEELRAQIKGAGIGTSATRAGIIEKLIKVGYLSLNKKTQVLTPRKLGEMIYEVVLMTLPGMLEPKMTASWEKGLSGVENGEISPEEYRDTLDKYVTKYVNTIKAKDISNKIAPNLSHIAEVNKK
jgi:DNA topoisomerase-3